VNAPVVDHDPTRRSVNARVDRKPHIYQYDGVWVLVVNGWCVGYSTREKAWKAAGWRGPGPNGNGTGNESRVTLDDALLIDGEDIYIGGVVLADILKAAIEPVWDREAQKRQQVNLGRVRLTVEKA
jgi:hypothetical protein